MIVRELVTRLGFDADSSEVRQYDDALQSARRTARNLVGGMLALTAAAGEFSRRISHTGNEVTKSATEAGLASREYQNLRFAMGQVAQVSESEADRALGRLNQRIGRARREGGKYAEALIDMGFSQQQINEGAISTGEAMEALTERLGRATDAQEASAIAGDILGTRIGRRLGPALWENGAAMADLQRRNEELGGGFSDLALDESEKLVDAFGEVSVITQTLSSDIAETLLPATREVIESFTEWWVANKDLIRQNIRRWVDGVRSGLSVFWSMAARVRDIVQSLVDRMGGWNNTLRLAGVLIGTLLAFRLGRWFMIVARGFVAAGAGVAAFSGALAKIPWVAFALGVALLVDDLWNWVQGNESAIGSVLGDWENFRTNWNQILDDIENDFDQFWSAMSLMAIEASKGIGHWIADPDNPINRAFEGLVDRSRGAIQRMLDLDGGGGLLFDASGQFRPTRGPDDVSGSGGTRRVNVTADVTIPVPQGTSAEQQRSLEESARRIFSREFDDQIAWAINDLGAQ